MSKTSSKLARSIWADLLKGAKERGEDPNFVLLRFAAERLLYRLSISAHKDRFVLKGAMLFAAWTDRPHRATKDVDLLGVGAPAEMVGVFSELCALKSDPEDAVVFDPRTVRVEDIREDADYEGRRIHVAGKLGTIKVSVQVDIGFGDAVSPKPVILIYPVLLEGLPAPRLRAYPAETVVAEKFEAMVKLGMGNRRMKDFYDLWVLSRTREFALVDLAAAVAATFERRGTARPEEDPLALTAAFGHDSSKQTQWKAFLGRVQTSEKPALGDVVERLQVFLGPTYRPDGQKALAWSPAAAAWRAR